MASGGSRRRGFWHLSGGRSIGLAGGAGCDMVAKYLRWLERCGDRWRCEARIKKEVGVEQDNVSGDILGWRKQGSERLPPLAH